MDDGKSAAAQPCLDRGVAGVRLLIASFRSKLALSASVAHLCCRPLRSGTLGIT